MRLLQKKHQLNPFKTKYKCDRRPSVLKKQGAVIKWENRRFFSLKKQNKKLLFGFLEKNQNQKYYIFCFKHKDCKAKHN